MKKFTLSMITVMAMSTLVIAGGDTGKMVEEVEAAVVPIIIEDDSSFYVGLAYSYVDAEIDGEQTGNGYSLLAGYNYNKYIAVEGRYTATVGDMDVENHILDGVDGKSRPDGEYEREVSSYGLFLKPQLPIGDAFSVYGLLGYGSVTARATDESGLQWGLGAQYSVTDSIGLFVDYTSLYDGDMDNAAEMIGEHDFDSQIVSTNVGLTYSF